MKSLRVGHDWATSLSLFTFLHWRRTWHPTPVLLPGISHGWREEPGRLQSMGSLRVGHDWATSLSLFTFMHWRKKWQPTPVFLPGQSQGRGAWWADVYGVAQSRIRLKRLSSSSSSSRKKEYVKTFSLLNTLDQVLGIQLSSFARHHIFSYSTNGAIEQWWMNEIQCNYF